jgi:hypothetical protein
MSTFSTSSSGSAGERDRLGGAVAWRHAPRSLLIAAPLLFAVPVALGIVVSVVRLVGIRYPDLGWATTVNSDAEQLYLGHTLYQNPAHGYTGQIYTPLYPVIVSLFDHLYLWNGWPLLAVIAASVSLIVLAARIAYPPVGPAPRSVRALGALGVGCIAYWCVASIKLPVLDEARADQLAWAFALFGLIAVADLGRSPSRRRVVLAVALLSAALWTKQTTVAVVAVAVAWVAALALFSALDRKAAALFAATLCGVNLAILLVLNLLTHGWEFFINFEVATLQTNEKPFASNLGAGLQCVALAAVFVMSTWLAGAAWLYGRDRRRVSPRPRARRVADALRKLLAAEDPTGRRALVLCLYVPVGFVSAAYFMRKQGTETNQLIGVVWAVGLFAAAGWRVAQRHAGTVAAAGGCVVLFFVLVQLAPVREQAQAANVSIPQLEGAATWWALPPELLAYARNHTIYIAQYSDLNVPEGGPLYPNYYNFADLLAAGTQPLYLVHALLNRRFDAVTYFPLNGNGYTSAGGKWEENYMWKLDEVITAGYAPSPGLPEGLLARRSGPDAAAWMRDCFGPFAAGGAKFRIHRGGGFWCSFSPESLRLVRAPVPQSEVVTTQPVRPAGTISVSLGAGVGSEIELVEERGSGQDWAVRVTPAPARPRDLVVSTNLGSALLGRRTVAATILPGGRRELRLGLSAARVPGPPVPIDPGLATVTAPAAKAPFAIVATSGVAVDLNGTRLGH